MNAFLAYVGYKRFKYEIGIILIVLCVLICMPIISVFAAANAGLQAISDVFAVVNPITHKVEIKDANGNIVATLDASTVWPTRGNVTLEFGQPSPYEEHHSGIDVAGNDHEPVRAFMDGRVTRVGHITEGCGTCIYIDHGNNITSSYSHLSAMTVTESQQVKAGDVIGIQGKEGWATGVHLHFSVRVYGILVNPRVFMVGEPTTL